MFGQFSVTQFDNPVEISSRPAQTLLAYLVLNSQANHRREKLAGLLWPDSEEENARTYLRQSLWRLRRELGRDFILADKIAVRLNPEAQMNLDVHLLEQPNRGSIRDLMAAVEVYAGPLMPGFFDDWVLRERERLRSVLDDRMRELVRLLRNAGRWGDLSELAERWIALNVAVEPGYRALMEAHAARGNKAGVAAAYERCVEALDRELGVEPSDETRILFGRLAMVIQPTFRTPANPYRGLFSFGEGDADYFFGRDQFLDRLQDKVRQSPITILLGPSGIGKSSSVFAGLLPRLRQESNLDVVAIRPGKQPFREPFPILAGVPGIENQEHSMDELLAHYREHGSGRLFLIIDQFEELFTLCNDEAERMRFLDLILASSAKYRADSNGRGVTVLGALRADYLGQALENPVFAQGVENSTLLLGPMTRDEMRQAIARPATLCNVAFEAGLVERVLDDVGNTTSNLPLLAFALARLWERKNGSHITHADYDAIGGVHGALTEYADRMYLELDAREQENARRVMIQMVLPSATGQGAMRVTFRRELDTEHWATAQKLVDVRLLTASRDANGQQTVELVHEALIRHWHRLRSWLEADRALRLWQEHLRADLRQWQAAGSNEDSLLGGIALAEASKWLAQRSDVLSPRERDFIKSSQVAEARQAAQQDQSRRRTILGLSAGLVVAAALAVVAGASWLRSERDHRAALAAYSLSLAANAQHHLEIQDNVTGLTLALTASNNSFAPAEVEHILLQAAFAPGPRQLYQVGDYSTDPSPIAASVAFHPDGQTVLFNPQANGTLVEIDLASGAVVRRYEGHRGYVNSITFSPNGRRALSTGDDGLVIYWDTDTGEPIHILEGHSGYVSAGVISPDGLRAYTSGVGPGENTLAALQAPGEIIEWDLASGQEVRRFAGGHQQIVLDLALSPDGMRLLSSSGLRKAVGLLPAQSNLVLWDIPSGEILLNIAGTIENPTRVAISPDGKTALIGSMEGAVYILALASGQVLERIPAADDWISGVAFSPDGQRAVISSGSGSLITWNLESGERIANLRLHTKELIDFELRLDGAQAFTVSADGSMVLWDLVDAAALQEFGNLGIPAQDAAFAPDGQTILTGDADGKLRLWDISSGRILRTFSGHSGPILAVALSADGTLALSGSADGTAQVWDVASGQPLARFTGHSGPVTSVQFRPGGLTALSSSLDRTIYEWEIDSGNALQLLAGHLLGVNSIAVSADGQTLISNAGEGLLVWDLISGAQLHPLSGVPYGGQGIVISPDGRLALSGSTNFDIAAFVWDIPSGKLLYRLPAESPVLDVALHPDGRHGLYVAGHGTVHLVDLDTGATIRPYRPEGADAILTVAFSPDGGTALASDGNGVTTLWKVVFPATEDLAAWISANRYVRELSCLERQSFQVEPLCPEGRVASFFERLSTPASGSPPASAHDQEAVPGQQRGDLAVGEYHVWRYSGQAGEQLTIRVSADSPKNHAGFEQALADGLLDAAIIVLDPLGRILTANHFDLRSDVHTTDAAVYGLVLPLDGEYVIQVRSFGNQTGGPYTLRIDSDR